VDVPLKMPDLATTGGAIKVLRWLVEPGRTIDRGEPLLEVETDKAVMQVESAAAGCLKTIVAAEGTEIQAGQTIAILERQTAARSSGTEQGMAAIAASPMPAVSPTPRPVPALHNVSRKSFFARNREARARRRSAVERPRTAAIALSVPQKVAARRMAESKRTVPHFYLQTSASAAAMVALRKAAPGGGLTWDAFFVRAAGKALENHERMNYRFEEDRLVAWPTAAVGVAVDLDGELFTLVIERAAEKSLEAISKEISAGVARLRAGDPEARMARPASLTISNLGGSGVESFAAVINPPESCILAVGKVMALAVVVDGQITVQDRVNFTLSVDHRVVSGKYAAGFLNTIVRQLESIDRSESEADSHE
jgi:pyruvate dehydrogenase E2 component (dihydrolipoamide acetyltransferase)